MKKILILAAFIVAFTTIYSTNQLMAKNTAVKMPSSRGYISDFANIMPNAHALTQILAQIERENSLEIAVVTINTTAPYTTKQYAVKIFKNWQIGKRWQDNGILILVAKNDKKVRIEVGSKLRPILNNAKIGEIIQKAILPFFRQSDYEKGIFAGVNYLGKILSIKTTPNISEQTTPEKIRNTLLAIFLIMLLIALRTGFFPYMLFNKNYYRKYYWRNKNGTGGFDSGNIDAF